MDSASCIRIIHPPTDTEPFVILDKPSGLPSAPLHPGEESAYTQAAARYPGLDAVCGKKTVEHGLVHRIDTATRGILLIAATQEYYAYLLDVQQRGLFIKHYHAICTCRPDCREQLGAFPPAPAAVTENGFEGTITSYFRPYGERGRAVRPVTAQAGKAARRKASPALYSTEVSLHRNAGIWEAACCISRGYRHQVRCHLAWLGFPIQGDSLYAPGSREGDAFCFTAESLRFPDEKTHKEHFFSIKSSIST